MKHFLSEIVSVFVRSDRLKTLEVGESLESYLGEDAASISKTYVKLDNSVYGDLVNYKSEAGIDLDDLMGVICNVLRTELGAQEEIEIYQKQIGYVPSFPTNSSP